MATWELLVCLVLIFLSGYLSASETALFSLSRFQLRSLKENFRPVHKKIKKLLSDPSGLLVTLLVLNEVVNIALSAWITESIAKNHIPKPDILERWPQWAFDAVLGILVTSPIVLVFCEVTPKVFGARVNQLVASLTAGPLSLIYRALKPIRLLLKKGIRTVRHFSRRHQKHPSEISDMTEEEIKSQEKILRESDFLLMLEEGQKEGAIQENEIELIRNVFELDNTPVSEISTPLSKVLSLPVSTTIKGALNAVKNHRYSRIPITGLNKTEVLGILYSKDLLRPKVSQGGSTTTVAAFMRKPFFVAPTMKLNALFRKFKQQKTHMAIVKDSDDQVIGVVTMNDILDTLFEDFLSEERELKGKHPGNHL